MDSVNVTRQRTRPLLSTNLFGFPTLRAYYHLSNGLHNGVNNQI